MGKNHVATFLLAVAIVPAQVCYTLKDLRDVACNVICLKDREHYERGVWDPKLNVCWCMDKKDFDHAMEKTLTLPGRYVPQSDTGQ